MKRGETYEWLPPGTDPCLGEIRPVTIKVLRSARDESWADVLCVAEDGLQWSKRHPTAPNCTPYGWRKVSGEAS